MTHFKEKKNMTDGANLTIQKVSDINEEYCSYELLYHGKSVLAVAPNSNGTIKVYISTPLNHVEVEYDEFVRALSGACRRAQEEVQGAIGDQE